MTRPIIGSGLGAALLLGELPLNAVAIICVGALAHARAPVLIDGATIDDATIGLVEIVVLAFGIGP